MYVFAGSELSMSNTLISSLFSIGEKVTIDAPIIMQNSDQERLDILLYQQFYDNVFT